MRESHKGPEKSTDVEKVDNSTALEEAKKVIIEENPSLPKAELIKISKTTIKRDVRVKIYGWIHRLRRQGRPFLELILLNTI